MPALLKHAPCPSCGHRHHFCLDAGELTAGRDYEFVCPETGRRAVLRLEVVPEFAPHSPQGAVQLRPAAGVTVPPGAPA